GGGSEVCRGRYRFVRSVESSQRRLVSKHGRPREPIACRFTDAAGPHGICRRPSSGCRARATQSRLRTDYAKNLRNFIASVRRDFNNPNLPFVFGEIIDFDHPVSAPSVSSSRSWPTTIL